MCCAVQWDTSCAVLRDTSRAELCCGTSAVLCWGDTSCAVLRCGTPDVLSCAGGHQPCCRQCTTWRLPPLTHQPRVTPGREGRTDRQDLLAGPAQDDGARLGLLAVGDEGEVLISDLLHLEQPGAGAHVLLPQLIGAADDARPAGPAHRWGRMGVDGGGGERRRLRTAPRRPRRSPGDAVVVRLPHPADGADVGSHQVVLGQV